MSTNNNELILRVNYNGAPIPATVLDVYMDYDENALQLIDTRPDSS